ncbi:MAG: type III PLP-dependent enzyme [Mycobacterium sp.]
MDTRRRSQLREELAVRAKAHRWEELIECHGTPLLVLDPAEVHERYHQLIEQLPAVELHYAVKAAPHPAVLRAVADCGGGFDVASTSEVDLVRSLGVEMSTCIHTHPIKKVCDIWHAYRAGIRTFVVDNAVEAQKFTGLPADTEILVRLAIENPSAKSDLSTKFGVDPADAELVVKHVLTAGVRFRGFSFHVGSQGTAVAPFGAAVRTARELLVGVRCSLGVAANTIDIGGGFPVTYREPMPALGAVAAVIRDALGADHDLTVLAEPGRFLAASSMTLLTSVVGTRVRGGRIWHYLDDGLYGTYSNILTEDVHPPILAFEELRSPQVREFAPVTLAGPTCDSVDVVARDYPMPALSLGDVVVSPMMGAYTAVTSSRFNGIAATPIVVAPGAGLSAS